MACNSLEALRMMVKPADEGKWCLLQMVACDSPVGRLGLTICYDLRFPELYQRLAFQQNAGIMLVPSAFTKVTGERWDCQHLTSAYPSSTVGCITPVRTSLVGMRHLLSLHATTGMDKRRSCMGL